jgi:hypothetical protein
MVLAHGVMPIAAWSAPITAWDVTDWSVQAGGAFAISILVIRSASSRGAPRAVSAKGNSRPARNARIQRCSVCQVPSAAAPTTRHGLILRRTCRLETRSAPYIESAATIATSENSRYLNASGGPAVSTAPQARQRYRRTRISSTSGSRPTPLGPRSCLTRTPCPTTTSFRPGGWLAAPQHTHRAGRTVPTSGVLFVQNLRFSCVCTSLVLLTSCGAWRGAGRPKLTPRRLFVRQLCAALRLLGCATYSIIPCSDQFTAMMAPPFRPLPSPSSSRSDLPGPALDLRAR